MMKICYKCGHKNFYSPGDKIVCQECGLDFNKNDNRHDDRPGCGVTKRKLMHDEMPWDFTHG